MKSRKLLTILMVLTLTLLAFTSCAPKPAAGGEITLYTSVPEGIINEIKAAFEEKNPDITLNIFREKTGKVKAKVEAELEAGEIQADLLWVAEPSTYEAYKDEDLFLKFTPGEAANLSDEFKDPDGYYYAGRVINMVLAYNSEATAPSDWKDLLNEEYKDQVGFATTSAGSALATVGMLTENPDFGWEFFDDLKANGAMQVKNNGTVRDQLSTGELKAGWVLDYMVRAAKAKGSPIDYVWPSSGAAIIPSQIAIFKDAKNPDAAKIFVDYILSADGQKTLVEKGNFVPIRADVDSPEGVPNLDEIAKLGVDWKTVKDKAEELNTKFLAIFGE